MLAYSFNNKKRNFKAFRDKRTNYFARKKQIFNKLSKT